MTDLRKAAEMALLALDHTARSAVEQYVIEQQVVTFLKQALAQPEQEKESTAQTVDPRLLLGRSNNFTKETENRLCDIERRLAAIETQSAPPRENNNG